MPGDTRDRIDKKALMGPMGQMAAALTAAGAELFGRSLEIGVRRLGSALGASVSPSARTVEGTGWVDALLQQYREYLGEMVLAAPLAAQRFQREIGRGTGDRLLFCATVARQEWNKDLPVLDELEHVQQRGQAQELAFTQPVLTDLWKTLQDGKLATVSTDAALKYLSGTLTGEAIDVSRASKVADELGRALRSKRLEQVPELWAQLNGALTAEGLDTGSLSRWREELRRVLGERAMRALFNENVLRMFSNALAGSKLLISGELHAQLKEAFASAGFQLSNYLSVVSGYRDWLICDHAQDLVFQVHREGDLREVYGREEGRSYMVGRKHVRLPARVYDASQGFVVYSVPKEALQDLLDLQPDRMLRAWDIGSRRTPVALFIVDYRDSDLGRYLELGVACFAAPKKDPLAMGMHVLQLPVADPPPRASDGSASPGDAQFSRDAGRKIWGYPKEVYALEFTYSGDSVTCVLRRNRDAPPLLALLLPRGGQSSSRNIPIYSYTRKGGLHHRTVFTRSGEGESIRRGGRGVRLQVSDTEHDPVIDMLRYLGVIDQTPIFSSWTERMSGEFGPAQALHFNDDS